MRAHSAKTAQRKRTRVPHSTSYELSYETSTIIVVLLLLFLYPVGIILMWAWMHSWPTWLKFLITLPLFLGVLAFFAALLFVGSFIGKMRFENMMQQRSHGNWYYQQTISPTPLPITLTPTQNTSGTY